MVAKIDHLAENHLFIAEFSRRNRCPEADCNQLPVRRLAQLLDDSIVGGGDTGQGVHDYRIIQQIVEPFGNFAVSRRFTAQQYLRSRTR